MNNIFKRMAGALMLVILVVCGGAVQKANAQPGVSVSFQTFYDALSPYGQWIDDPEYGYVWAPQADRDFRPYYTNGRWVMTEYGNTWVSDYQWGWAPFHYGRWSHNDYYGWVWVPDNTWGPAWVSWRSGGDCYGWAPIAPRTSINISIGPRYRCPNDWWVFIPQRHIYSNGWRNHYRGPRYNNTYINNTTIINNTYITNNNTYIMGPRRRELERVTGQRVNVYNLRNENRPGRTMVQNNNVNIYRPNVSGPRSGMDRPQQVARNDRNNNRPGRGERMNTDNNSGRNEQRGRNEVVRTEPERVRTERNNDWTSNNRPDRQNNIERPERAERPGGTEHEDVARAERGNRWQDQNAAIANEPRNNWNSRQPEQTQQQPNRTTQRLERAEQQQRIENNRQQRWERQQQPERVDRQMQTEHARPQRSERQPQMDRPAQVEHSRPQRMERAESQGGGLSESQSARSNVDRSGPTRGRR